MAGKCLAIYLFSQERIFTGRSGRRHGPGALVKTPFYLQTDNTSVAAVYVIFTLCKPHYVLLLHNLRGVTRRGFLGNLVCILHMCIDVQIYTYEV